MKKNYQFILPAELITLKPGFLFHDENDNAYPVLETKMTDDGTYTFKTKKHTVTSFGGNCFKVSLPDNKELAVELLINVTGFLADMYYEDNENYNSYNVLRRSLNGGC